MLRRRLGHRRKKVEKIPIMIDSSVLKQIRKLNSPLMNQLIKYVSVGKFQLYFSVIIEEEYLTWIKKNAQEAYDKIVSASQALDKFYDVPSIMGIEFKVNMTAQIAQQEINHILHDITDKWDKFKKRTNAIILPIEKNHGRLVMNAYFKGDKPFKEIKSRNDIPDAFIYFSILEILKNHDKVLFISRDKEFVKRIKNENIIIFENLNELFYSSTYCLSNDFFSSLNETNKAYRLIKYFQDEIQKKTERVIELSDLVSDIEYESQDKNIIGMYKETRTTVNKISLDYSNIKCITEYSYLVFFTADLIHQLLSMATKEDLNGFNSQRIENLKEKEINDDGLYDIIEEFTTNVSGNISITFDKSDPLLWKEQEVKGFFNETEIKEIEIVLENIEKSI